MLSAHQSSACLFGLLDVEGCALTPLLDIVSRFAAVCEQTCQQKALTRCQMVLSCTKGISSRSTTPNSSGPGSSPLYLDSV